MTYDIIYSDDTDRSYGLTGMMVSLAVFNSEEKILEINLDSRPDTIFFSPDFYFSGNPRCSAKIVWGELASHFRLALAMAIGNILSRRLVSQNTEVSSAERRSLHDLAVEEGAEVCGLEPDEIEKIWDKDFDYLNRVFRHPKVQRITNDIASQIERRRSLSRYELLELLSALNIL